MAVPALRYLSAVNVEACLPELTRQIELAERALESLAQGDAEMPPKIGVHPRPGALLHAMPAWLRSDDLVGVKWVSAYPGNSGRGRPSIQGLIVLNDAGTGTPLCVMDAATITAARTAAVSGAALRVYARDRPPRRAAILGAGVQARSHLPVLQSAVSGNDGLEVTVFDRHPERSERFATWATARPGVRGARVAADAADAARGADIVVTAGAISKAQVMGTDWLTGDALVIAVDFAAHASADLARTAATFAVDDRAQFMAYRDSGNFDGYPDPTETLGEAIARSRSARPTRPANGTGVVLVTHLGVGTADILFANEVARAAEERGLGALLER